MAKQLPPRISPPETNRFLNKIYSLGVCGGGGGGGLGVRDRHPSLWLKSCCTHCLFSYLTVATVSSLLFYGTRGKRLCKPRKCTGAGGGGVKLKEVGAVGVKTSSLAGVIDIVGLTICTGAPCF